MTHGLLVFLSDLPAERGRLPKERGPDGLFFGCVPGITPTAGCLNREGLSLLYIGSAGSGLQQNGALRNRLGDQPLAGNERRSAARQTLAALLPEVVGPAVARQERNLITYHTSPQGAERLRHWMDRTMAVCWIAAPQPADFEAGLIERYTQPLNLNCSAHPFAAVLIGLRAIRWQAATKLAA